MTTSETNMWLACFLWWIILYKLNKCNSTIVFFIPIHPSSSTKVRGFRTRLRFLVFISEWTCCGIKPRVNTVCSGHPIKHYERVELLHQHNTEHSHVVVKQTQSAFWDLAIGLVFPSAVENLEWLKRWTNVSFVLYALFMVYFMNILVLQQQYLFHHMWRDKTDKCLS